MDTVGCEIEMLATMRARMRGLLGREPDEAWHVLVPCKDVHTFGMLHELDVAFLGRDGRVLAVHYRVDRGRRLRCGSAVAVIERFARDDPWLHPGERVVLSTLSEEGPSTNTESGKDAR